MTILWRCIVLLIIVIHIVSAQWNEQAMREEEYFATRMRNAPYQQNAGGNLILPVICSFVGGVAGDWLFSRNAVKKAYKKHGHDLKVMRDNSLKQQEDAFVALTAKYRNKEAQYAEATLTLQQLTQAANDAGINTGVTQQELDYEEFKQPDTNNDNKITKQEFDAYIRQYLRQYPHISANEVPRFEDFDVSRDGSVSFGEWQAYLDSQRRDM